MRLIALLALALPLAAQQLNVVDSLAYSTGSPAVGANCTIQVTGPYSTAVSVGTTTYMPVIWQLTATNGAVNWWLTVSPANTYYSALVSCASPNLYVNGTPKMLSHTEHWIVPNLGRTLYLADILTSITPTQGMTLAISQLGVPPEAVNGQSICVMNGAWTNCAVLLNPLTTSQDLIVGGSGGALSRLPIGANGTFLRVSSGIVNWGALVSADITGPLGYTPENAANKGAANGYAGLDSGAHCLAANSPAYSGDVSKPAGSLTTAVQAVNGTSVPTNSASDQTIITTAPATGSWGALPSCPDVSGNHINYSTTAHAFSCGNTGGTAESVASFSGIGAGTNANALLMSGSLDVSGGGYINANRIMGAVLSGISGVVKMASGVPSAAGPSDVIAALAYTPENLANKGAASGYASLDSGAHLPASQLTALTGDVSRSAGSNSVTVTGMNGHSLAGLSTGLLKNTTGTGAPSIAASSDVTTTLGYTPENSANKGATNGYTPLVSGTVPLANLPSVAVQAGYTPENLANKGAASGYAPLNSSSQVPLANLPTIPLSQTSGITPSAIGAATSTATATVNGTACALAGSCNPPIVELYTAGSAITANTFVSSGSTAGQVVPLTTSSTTWYGLALNSASSSGSVSVLRLGSGSVLIDGPVTLGDSAIASTSSAGYAHDSGTTRNSVSILDSVATFHSACSTSCYGSLATVEITPADRGTLITDSQMPSDFVSTGLINGGTLSPTFGTVTATAYATSGSAFQQDAIQESQPSNPATGKDRLYADPTNGFSQIDPSGNLYTMLPECATAGWLDFTVANGLPVCRALASSDVTTALGFTPAQLSSGTVPLGELPSVATQLGYTPANIANITAGYVVATADSSGVTANYLVKVDTSGQYANAATGSCGNGIADSTATSATFNLYMLIGSVLTGTAENAVTAGHYLTGGSSTGGMLHDTGQVSRANILDSTQICGIATQSVSSGNTFTFLWNGGGLYGAETQSVTGDVTITAGGNSATVTKVNNTSLAGLGTGILKNTTGTGVPSIAAASDVAGIFPAMSVDVSNASGSTAVTVIGVNGALVPNCSGAGCGWLGTNSSGQLISVSGGSAPSLTVSSANTSSVTASAGQLTVMNCSLACAVTLPGTPTSNSFYPVLSYGSTVASITLGGSATFNGASTAPTLATGQISWFISGSTAAYYGDIYPVAWNTAYTPATGRLLASSGNSLIGESATPYPGTTVAAGGSDALTQKYTLSGTTAVGDIVKLTTSSDVTNVGTSSVDAIGIATSTSSPVYVAVSGVVACNFDNSSTNTPNSVTIGDFVQISTATAAYCHDTGTATFSSVSSGVIIGRVVDGCASSCTSGTQHSVQLMMQAH